MGVPQVNKLLHKPSVLSSLDTLKPTPTQAVQPVLSLSGLVTLFFTLLVTITTTPKISVPPALAPRNSTPCQPLSAATFFFITNIVNSLKSYRVLSYCSAIINHNNKDRI